MCQSVVKRKLLPGEDNLGFRREEPLGSITWRKRKKKTELIFIIKL